MTITPFYKPGKAPNADERAAKEIVLFLERELNALSQAFTELYLIKFRELHVEPERPRDGMFAYADGVNWNPGNGEGHYGRVADAWVPATIVPENPSVRAVRIQRFTASSTYTPHANMLYCIIEAVGGGGGGGAVDGDAASSLWAGGGGSGSYSRSVKTAADIGASKAVTIGGGGGGGAGGGSGAAGTATSVGSLVIANGGNPATGASTASYSGGGLGASAGTGDLAMPGRNGRHGFYCNTVATIIMACGWGADSVFGVGGAASLATTGGAGTFGGGGGGAGVNGSASDYTGGAGGAGLVIITEFCSA